MLKRSEIKDVVTEALASSRKLKLTFNRDAYVDIYYLLGMINGKIVEMDEFAMMNLMAVGQSKRWENVSRDVFISLPSNFDEEWFLGRMNERALEKIGVA